MEDTSEPFFYYKKHHEDEDGIKENIDMIEMTNNEPVVKALEPMQKAINDIDLNIEKEIPPSFYYYKRWLWMIFPWACLQTD